MNKTNRLRPKSFFTQEKRAQGTLWERSVAIPRATEGGSVRRRGARAPGAPYRRRRGARRQARGTAGSSHGVPGAGSRLVPQIPRDAVPAKATVAASHEGLIPEYGEGRGRPRREGPKAPGHEAKNAARQRRWPFLARQARTTGGSRGGPSWQARHGPPRAHWDRRPETAAPPSSRSGRTGGVTAAARSGCHPPRHIGVTVRKQ